jgi:hypothetical protein
MRVRERASLADVLHQNTGPSNFTGSDLLAHWDELAQTPAGEIAPVPRRTQSMMNFNRPRYNLPLLIVIVDCDVGGINPNHRRF